MKHEICPNCGNNLLSQHRLPDGTIVEQCKSCLHTWEGEATFFQGEMMICELCGKEEKSDPNKSLNWRVMQLDDTPHYVCPRHFPPDNAKAADFKHAYKYVMQKLMARKAN